MEKIRVRPDKVIHSYVFQAKSHHNRHVAFPSITSHSRTLASREQTEANVIRQNRRRKGRYALHAQE